MPEHLKNNQVPKITIAALIFMTPLFIWLSHYVAVFPHEYAHSFTAWLLGDMKNPLALDYGGSSLRNILLLWDIDENVEYQKIFAAGHDLHAALIAFAGAGFGNGLLFILCRYMLGNNAVKQMPWLYYFIFWLQLMNLGNFYDYVPIRVFSSHGDMGNLTHGLHISPWWLFIIIGYLVAFLTVRFFTTTIQLLFINLRLQRIQTQACLIIICVLIFFGWFGGIFGPLTSPDPMRHGEISYFLEITSFAAIPGILFMLWPSRAWFRERMRVLKACNGRKPVM